MGYVKKTVKKYFDGRTINSNQFCIFVTKEIKKRDKAMIQKRRKQKDKYLICNDNVIEETVRKSHLNASSEFDFKKIGRRQEGFLNCTIEEDKESLTISYDIHNLLPWSEIRREKRELIFAALIDAGKLQNSAEMYNFTLNPDNLFYDIQGRVFVKARDVYGSDKEYAQEDFLKEYKSLIGSTLVKKYKVEDYNSGGEDLLSEDKFLSVIMECTDVEQILDKLHQEFFRYRKEHKARFVEISRLKNRTRKIALGISTIFFMISAALLSYQFLWIQPYEKAVIAANEVYLQSDYSGTIEAMAPVDVSRMNVYQKYILAYFCVRCESFSDDNMIIMDIQ